MASCDDLVTNQDLANTKKDAVTVSDFVESNNQTTTSKNGKIIRTLQGANNDAQDAINSFKIKSKGQYLPDPVTLNDAFEYVVFGDKTYFAVSPPYTTDPVTYPDPASDTVNLIEQSYLTRGQAEIIATEGDEQLAGLNVWPINPQVSAQIGDTGLVNVSILRDQLTKTLYKTSEAVSGQITSLDFSAKTANVGGTPVTLSEFSINTISNAGDSQLAGGAIWPLSSQDSAQVGDDLTGFTYIRLTGGDFLSNFLFTVEAKDKSGVEPSGTIGTINLSSKPYDITIGGVDFWLLDHRYCVFGSKPTDARAFFAVGDGVADDIEPINALATMSRGIYLPGGHQFRITQPIIYENATIKGDGKEDRTAAPFNTLSALLCDTSINSTDYFIENPKELDGFIIKSTTSKQGKGINVSSPTSSSFTGWNTIRNVRVLLFEDGVNINNVFVTKLEDCIIETNVRGMTVTPVFEGGDNGYFTTLYFNNVVWRNNDDYGFDISPELKSPNLCFKNCNLESNKGLTNGFQGRLFNCDPFSIDNLYVEGEDSVDAIVVNSGCVGTFKSLYANDCGAFDFGVSGTRVDFDDFKVTGGSTNAVIKANGGSIQQLTFSNSLFLFDGGTFPSIGSLRISNSNVDGIGYNYVDKGTLARFNFNGDEFRSVFTRVLNIGATLVPANDRVNIVTNEPATSFTNTAASIASLNGQYLPGLVLEVRPGTTGVTNFISVDAINTTGSDINIAAGEVCVVSIRIQ